MSGRSRSLVSLAALVAVAPFLLAASAPPKRLTVEWIMRGPGLVGYEPRDVRFSGDGRRIYFGWKQSTDPVLADLETYVVDREKGSPRKLTEDEARLAPPARGERSGDGSMVVFVRESDLYVYDYAQDRGRRLTQTRDVEGGAHFLRDGKRVSFVRANNLFVVSLEDGLITKRTNFRTPPSGPDAPRSADDEDKQGTDSQEFLEAEERTLLDVVRQREEKKDADDARRQRDAWRKPRTLKPRQSIRDMQLTADEKHIVALLSERTDKGIRTVVPNYVAQKAYAETIPSRTKVGDEQDRVQLAIVDAASGEQRPVDHAPLSGVTASMPFWSRDGERAVLMGRAADNKQVWVLALDVAAAKTRVLATDRDDAWIGGPGIFTARFGDEGFGPFTLGWLKDERSVYFQSERTGFSHLYVVPFEGGEPQALTSGTWEVLRAWLSEDKERFYLETNEGDAGQRHLYWMNASGGERTRLTSGVGFHDTRLSRDGGFVADVHSRNTAPPELHVQEARAGAASRRLTTSPAPDFASRAWLEPQTVAIPARDKVSVPGHLFKKAGAPRGGPAVIFVHGAGYMQNVHRGWSSYAREYLFHNLLVERGYTVLQLDYRGSAGYGRDWRTAIYRHMGGKDLSDHTDAARWLAETQGVDPKRIGIYGGSYGGFITLMAMFTQPDVFAAGAALRPVTDWAHYNHSYTSDILNLPHSDREAYRKSSPIYFAEGLKGALLICHGMVDTNVHFQDAVRLTQRLIELGKENWELAVFPVENHGFVQPSSWADEYRRILKLFETNLRPAAGARADRG